MHYYVMWCRDSAWSRPLVTGELTIAIQLPSPWRSSPSLPVFAAMLSLVTGYQSHPLSGSCGMSFVSGVCLVTGVTHQLLPRLTLRLSLTASTNWLTDWHHNKPRAHCHATQPNTWGDFYFIVSDVCNTLIYSNFISRSRFIYWMKY